MSDDRAPAADDTLQFDRAVPLSTDAAGQAGPSLTCESCKNEIKTEYFTVNGVTLCETCKDAVQQQAASVREWPSVIRATLFGFGAALVGAIIYYGVIAITDFEIGIVAILIGYMVGYAMRKGARERGGRRLQIIAIVLTYLSVALAYLPLAMRGARESSSESGLTIDSAQVLAPTTDSTVANADTTENARGVADSQLRASSDSLVLETTFGGTVRAIGLLLVFSLTLPVFVVFGSMPSGLISALIIGIGLRQAWKMTGVPDLETHGPFKVGAVSSASAAPPAAS